MKVKTYHIKVFLISLNLIGLYSCDYWVDCCYKVEGVRHCEEWHGGGIGSSKSIAKWESDLRKRVYEEYGVAVVCE